MTSCTSEVQGTQLALQKHRDESSFIVREIPEDFRMLKSATNPANSESDADLDALRQEEDLKIEEPKENGGI